MSDWREDLIPIIEATTTTYRKGASVESDGASTTIWGMPHVSEAPPELVPVDVHFMVVGVDKAGAEDQRAQIIGCLHRYPDRDTLRGGPSYIIMGGALGDQGLALRLFALGEVLGLWRVITPEKMGAQGPQGDRMAGMGYVMMSGFAG